MRASTTVRGMARTWGRRLLRRAQRHCYSGAAGAQGSSERWQTLEAWRSRVSTEDSEVGYARRDDKGAQGHDSPWPDRDVDAMLVGRCRVGGGYGAGKRESPSGECRRSDDGPATADATAPEAAPAACMKLARGWPRMSPARVSCSLMPALYAATRSLSCALTVSSCLESHDTQYSRASSPGGVRPSRGTRCPVADMSCTGHRHGPAPRRIST